MKKVLIVSPHFPPVNAPDMQRVRLSLPFLQAYDWDPVVLALEPEMVEGAVIEPRLLRTFPAHIEVVRVRGLAPRMTRWAGIGSLWLRCGRALRRAGDRLLRERKFDLVFISTTQFDAFQLGPRWLKAFGVPYVVDYQDPWQNPYYAESGTRPPGGRAKFWWSQHRAHRLEPLVLRQASVVMAVSPAYGPMLAKTHPWFDPTQVQVLPFGAAKADFAAITDYRPDRSLVPFGDGGFHHVYVGRGGADMTFALTVLFRAFQLFLASHRAEAITHRFHFIGTSYAPPPGGQPWAMPLARAEGVSGFVQEHCHRVPYFDALWYLVNADALVAVGSADRSYSASKVYPYLLSRRPLLLIYHRDSEVLRHAARSGAPVALGFDGQEDIAGLARQVHEDWFANGAYRRVRPADESAFEPFLADSLTARLARIFDRAMP